MSLLLWAGFHGTTVSTRSPYGTIHYSRQFGKIVDLTMDPDRDGIPDILITFPWRSAPWSEASIAPGNSLHQPNVEWRRVGGIAEDTGKSPLEWKK